MKKLGNLIVFLVIMGVLFACGAAKSEVKSPPPPWIGTKQLGVQDKTTKAYGIAVDSNGNVYVAGFTTGGLDENKPIGEKDAFLTKYDSSGNKIRTKQLGVPGQRTGAWGVAVDLKDNVYVTGYTYGNLDGNMRKGTIDAFLTKYDSEGKKLYTKLLGVATADTMAEGVAVDSSDNVYVTGYTTGGLGQNTLMGAQDLFLTKYDSDGNIIRTKQLGVAGRATTAHGAAVDSQDNVYVTGSTTGDLDEEQLTGTKDLFLTKYDSDGNKKYTKLHSVAGKVTVAFGVAVDSKDNVYVTGYATGGSGLYDLFLTKYTPKGTWKYTEPFGVVGEIINAYGVAVDSSDNVYVTGYTTEGPGTTVFFITKYGSEGNEIYRNLLGNWGETAGRGAAVDSSDNVFVTGFTTDGLDGNKLTGDVDFFVAKYDSALNLQ